MGYVNALRILSCELDSLPSCKSGMLWRPKRGWCCWPRHKNGWMKGKIVAENEWCHSGTNIPTLAGYNLIIIGRNRLQASIDRSLQEGRFHIDGWSPGKLLKTREENEWDLDWIGCIKEVHQKIGYNCELDDCSVEGWTLCENANV